MDNIKNSNPDCRRCGNPITQEDKKVTLKTSRGRRIFEELAWHYNCWTADFEERCVSRAEYLFKNSMKKGLAVAKNLMAARA